MTRPPPESPERKLADAERALVKGEAPTWADLVLEPARIDPDEPRKSAAELALLARALGRDRAAPARPEFVEPARFGYQIAILGGTAVSWPAFAEALSLGDDAKVRAAGEDLWRLDAAIFARLDQADPPQLARHWLTSPGRRLFQDLGLLPVMAAGVEEDGATDLRWDRLLDAAGATGPSPSKEHASIHGAWPGAVLTTWPARDVVHAVYTLEQGWPVHARAGALCWLLRRAATDPIVSLAGVRRHLGEELPARIALAMERDIGALGHPARLAKVEILCAAHAARIARAHGHEDKVEATWHLARWLQSTTMASPFYGGDLESLAARLQALLPSEAEPPPLEVSPLAPARFGGHEHAPPQLDLTEHAWASAAFELGDDRTIQVGPAPQPLIEALRQIAARGLTETELVLERGLRSEVPHVAPPLIAARTLSEHIRASWLEDMDPAAVEHLSRLLDHRPDRLRWLAVAILDHGDTAPLLFATELRARWSRPEALSGWSPEERCALGIGLSAHWQAGDGDHLLQQMVALDATIAESKPALLRQLLRLQDRHADGIRLRALHALMDDAERVDLPDRQRLESLGVALPWLAALGPAERHDQWDRARILMDQRPFRDSVPLRRELRRLGLGAA